MPRSIRIQAAGAYYHIMARGNHGEAIVFDDADRRFFVDVLGQACAMTGWRVQAWVLMKNHYHLFLQTPEPNLVAGMAWLQNTLTRRYNVRHQPVGRLFGDRYKAVLVEGTDPYHYQTLVDYIHLNPVRARLIRPKAGKSVQDYRWSSLAAGYALPPKQRPPWLDAASGLQAFKLEDTAAGRRQMLKRLDRRALIEDIANCGVPPLPAEADARSSHLRRGWYWGTSAFGAAMRKLAAKPLKQAAPKSRSPKGAAHSEQQAEIWLKQGLQAASLKPAEVAKLKGSDARKLLLADLLWSRTTVSQEWLAEKLAMKSAANVSQQLRRLDREKVRERSPEALRVFVDAVGNFGE
jgi:REP element-mobilizing transposase RayT